MTRQLLVVLLVVVGTSLHVPNHKNQFKVTTHELTDMHITHLQEYTQSTIQTHLDLLANQLSLLQQSYQQVNNLPEVEAIGSQGSIIKCKNISQLDQTELKYSSEHIETDLWSVYFEIQQLSKQGGQTDTLALQYQQLKKRKQILEAKSFIFCPQSKGFQTQKVEEQENSFSDISSNAFISNLEANSNWTYGKISSQQYQINQFQFLLANDVIKCPKQAPFASNEKCISCKGDEIFFLDTGLCSSCFQGTVFDNQTHLCLIQTNLNCKSNQVFNKQTNKCQCPSGLPYFNGTQCLGCYIPKYWNSQTKKCQSCPKGKYYSIVNGSCVECSDQTNFVSSLSSCHDECALSKPFYDGDSCLYCPQIFNPETRKCEQCQKGFYFNQEKGICSQKDRNLYPTVNCSKGYIFNRQNGQCVKQSECSCPTNYVYNTQTKKCQCPKSMPFDTGITCVSCQDPNIWNQSQKKCIEPLPVEAIPIQKVPVITVQNVTVNKTTQTCNPGETWNNSTKTCTCSVSTPYRTLAGQCVQCLPPNQWSKTLRQCLPPAPTCKSNFVFDPSTQSCVCPKDKPFSNGEQCQSCYLPMYWNNLEKVCKQCPNNLYFNPLTRKCQLCPYTRPLLVNHVCQACQQGTKYNKLNQRCETITCYDSAIYSEQKNDCYCPDRLKPFYNGSQCVSCMSPNRWDLASRSCVYDSTGVQDYSQPVQM